MKRRKARVAKQLSIKHEIIPNVNDTIQTEEVKLEQLPSECDIVDIPIKQEESVVEVKHYGANFSHNIAGVSSLTSFNEPSIDNNITEELNSNTTELSLQFDCQYCSLIFKSETLYNKHLNEVHRLESSNKQVFCQTCDFTCLNLEIYHNHLAQVHPLSRRAKSKPNRSIELNPDDPNFYCKSCDTKYMNNRLFQRHIRDMHKTAHSAAGLIRKPKSKPNHNIEPDPNNPDYYCKSCDKKYSAKNSFRQHLRCIHKIVDLPRKRRPYAEPNHNIQPDLEDPNFYCKSCNVKYANTSSFRAHLRRTHKIVDLPLKKRPKSKPNHSVKPDPDDPNFYCKSCDTKYATSAQFRSHVRSVHKTVYLPRKIKPMPKPNRTVEPDPDDPNFYCKSCATRYANRTEFRRHIRSVHKMLLAPLKAANAKPNHNIKPDPDDPNFYCKSCATRYANRTKFRMHLSKTHKMVLVPIKVTHFKTNHSIKPDPNDSNFYCKSCSIKYPSLVKFRQHLRQTHKMILTPLIKTPSIPNHSIKPDPYDPNYYCKSCNSKYATKKSFRAHIRKVHKTVNLPSKRKSKSNHSIEPDPDDPKFYCKSCSNEYPNRTKFRSHLRAVHDMVLIPLYKRRKINTKP